MKLNEVIEVHDTAGKAALAFADYLSHMQDFLPDRTEQQLKKLASALIRHGFYFMATNALSSPSFVKNDIRIILPHKNMTATNMKKVVLFMSPGSRTFDLSIAKATRIDYDQVFSAYEKILEAEQRLQDLLK